MNKDNSSIFKTTVVKELFNQALNGDNYLDKVNNKLKLEERFQNTNDFKSFQEESAKIVYDPKELKRVSTQNTKLTETISKLQANKIESEEDLMKLAETEGVKIPANIKGVPAVSKRLVASLGKTKAALDKRAKDLTELRTKKTELTNVVSKKQKEFRNAENTDFKEWKQKIMTENEGNYGPSTKAHPNPKYESLFSMLESYLSSAPEDKQEMYRFNINLLRASKNCVILSKADQTVKWFLNQAIKRYFVSATKAMFERRGEAMEEEEETKSVLLPIDLAKMDLTTSPYQHILETELVRQLSTSLEGPVQLEDTAAYSRIMERGQASQLLSEVSKYKPTTDVAVSEEFFVLVSGLLDDLVERLGKVVGRILATHNGIITIKSDIFHSILEPAFIMRGMDYSKEREEIESIWAKKVVEPTAPKQ